MIIEEEAAEGIRNLKAHDSVQINGQKYEVEYAEEPPEPGPDAGGGAAYYGFRMELKKAGESTASFSLVLSDMEISYTLELVLAGPPPMNSNPDILFVQDFDNNKTYKYRIARRRKEPASLAFYEGAREVEINSIRIM